MDVFPNVETFVTHHTYITILDCKLVSTGTYAVLTKPQHGEVAFKTVLYTDKPGQPCPGTTFPYATVYYTWTDTQTTDRQDVFEVQWIPPPSSDAQPVDTVATIEEGPRIIFQGKDITNTTQTVALGQQIALTSTPIADGQTQSWTGDLAKNETVGGYTASGNYPQTGAKGMAAVKATNFTQDSTTFYWTTLGTKNVTYTVHAGGQTGTAQATFKVQGPKCVGNCVKTQLGDVQIFAQGQTWWLSFGNIKTASVPGIIFTETAGPCPQPCLLPGQYVWVQLLTKTNLTDYLQNGGVEKCTVTPKGTALDTYFPLPLKNASTLNDSPSVVLQSAWSKFSESNDFEMYLMWQSSTSGSIPVPLDHVTWSFSATAVQNPKNKSAPWSLTASSKSAASHAGNDFPLWTYVSGTGAPLTCH